MLEGTPIRHQVQLPTETEADLKVLDYLGLFKSLNHCSFMKNVTTTVRLVGMEIFLVFLLQKKITVEIDVNPVCSDSDAEVQLSDWCLLHY